MQIQFAIDGELELSRRLTGMAMDVEDWSPAFSMAVDDLKQVFSGPVFDTEGREVDETWSPLSQAYALRKAKKYPGKKILEATGAMRNSFVSKFDATSATIWNTATYFKYHQSREPRTKMPRRVMMKLTENLKQLVVEDFNRYMRDTVMQ